MSKQQGLGRFHPKLISIAVASCFVTGTALANPTGHTVVHGNVTVKEVGNLLKIHNSPNAVINWQSFSINANEVTRFIQESRNSAVMNRVVGVNGLIAPSAILGALKSNGKVYLLNSAGVVFGAGSTVDVAGLVASSLKLSDADFQANRLRFTDGAGAGSVANYGNISGGEVYLIGSAVTNGGVITSPQGHVVLAAGKQVELVNPGTPNLRVEITAPDNQVLNLGDIVAESGRIGIYAGLINNSGTIRADSAVAEGGKILLKATKSVTLESSSVLNASGNGGGTIEVLADMKDGTVNVAGLLDASAPGGGDGGFVETSAANVRIADGTRVTTLASRGRTGDWLVDPSGDYIIGVDGNVSGATVSNNLATSNQIHQTTADGGNLYVDDPILWDSSYRLTLIAHNDVNVNNSIVNGGSGDIRLYAGWNGNSTSTPVVRNGFGWVNLNAPVQTGGDVFLIAGYGVGQTGSAPVSANGLLAKAGPGGVYLWAMNDVRTIAGEAENQFYLWNGRTLTVDSVGGVSGIRVEGESAYVQLSVSNEGPAHLHVRQNIIANAGAYGGGIYLSTGSQGDVTVQNATLRANSASYSSLYIDGREVSIDNSTLEATGTDAYMNIYGYGQNGVNITNSTLETQASNSYGTINVATGFSNGNINVESSQITAKGHTGTAILDAYGGKVTVKSSVVTATGQTGADGGGGYVGIFGGTGIDTTDSTFTATGKNPPVYPPQLKTGAANYVPDGGEGDNGILVYTQQGDIKLGSLSSNGPVTVQTDSGKIVDGNSGANIAAPSAFLFGAEGVGSISNPLETQLDSLNVSANTGQIGIINSGDLRLDSLFFSGSDAAIGATGTLRLGNSISVPGNLALGGNNGMVVDQSIFAGGDLSLAAGAGDLGIFGVPVEGHNVNLQGNSILIGSTTGTAPTSVTASHLVKATSTLNFNVIGGANSSASSVVRGENVDLSVGGVVNISGGSAYAQIESTLPTTITLDFPNGTSGGFFVNGNENVIADGNTGFFAAGQPAVLGESLKVTYGGSPANPIIDQQTSLITDSLNNAGDAPWENNVTPPDPNAPEAEKGKSLPVCQ